ncbi:polyamine ABC transporter substrate-binding protein [Brevibacillus dissolubilis]|uniref:polyamine ABC transporter substrate-binding protein n=1 Tax=Brevibacillus dissolubilis TaxID=1844116 RepID=UPI0011173857|nr:spermidine/putrescine ABC transporter substrate-binding protein [Brevibacillus dissolubilis]
MNVLQKLAPFLFTASLLTTAVTGCQSPPETLNIYSWADNFSPDVIADFEKTYHVKVNYDVFSSNEELYAKLKAGSSQYDLIQPSDYMVTTMIKQDMLEPLNKEAIPNLQNISSTFQTPPYDPGNRYSVIYTWGVTGIAYNTKYIRDPIDSWADLWNPAYKNRVVVLNDPREALGMSLIKNGFSNSTQTPAELATAYQDLKTLLPNLLAFDTDNIKQKFIAEEAWIGTVWSGDAAFIYAENKDVAFVLPKEGGTIWADTLAIPKGAKNKKWAEAFINYLLEPTVSVKNYEDIGYSNPNEKAYPLHTSEYRQNKMIFIEAHDLARTEWIEDVGEQLNLYDRYWTELKTGR